MILFGYIDNNFVFWQMLCHFLFNFSLTDVIIKVCVEDIIPHLADVIAICEMVLPHFVVSYVWVFL